MRNPISRKNTLFTIYLFLILILPIQAHSADVTLAWDKNRESNIAGYRLFSRLNNQGYDQAIKAAILMKFYITVLFQINPRLRMPAPIRLGKKMKLFF